MIFQRQWISILPQQTWVRASQSFYWMVLIVFSYMLARSISGTNEFFLFASLSLLLSLVILQDEKLGVAVALVIAFYWPYFADLVNLSNIFTNLSFAPILFLFARRVSLCTAHARLFTNTPLNNSILALFAFIFMSYLMGDNPLAVAFKGAAKHMVFVLLFIVVATSTFSERFIKKIITGIVTIAFVQIPASIIQYYFIYFDRETGFRYDNSAGLLGFSSGGVNAVFMTYVFSILLGFMITHGTKPRYLVGVAGLLVPIVLSSARAGLLFIPLTGLLIVMSTSFRQIREKAKTLFRGFALLICVAGVIALMSRKHQVEFITDPAAVYSYSMKRTKKVVGRLQTFSFVHNSIASKPISMIFGLGPGSITKTSFLGRSKHDFWESNQELLTVPNSYAYSTLELGYGGLLIFLYLHFKIFLYARVFMRNSDDKYWTAIAIGLLGIACTSAYSILYTNTWVQSSLSFCLWFMAGGLYRVGRVKGIFVHSKEHESTVRLPIYA